MTALDRFPSKSEQDIQVENTVTAEEACWKIQPFPQELAESDVRHVISKRNSTLS